jgi:hypothetical protein
MKLWIKSYPMAHLTGELSLFKRNNQNYWIIAKESPIFHFASHKIINFISSQEKSDFPNERIDQRRRESLGRF